MNWPSRPFVRFIFFFTVGILAATHIPWIRTLSFHIIIIVFILSLLSTAAVTIYLKSYRYRFIGGITLSVSIIFAGILLTLLKLNNNNNSKALLSNKTWLAEVVSEPKINSETIKTIVKLKKDINNRRISSNSVKAILFFQKDSRAALLKPGDILFVNTSLHPPEKVKNPDAFNYATFLNQKGIYFISFVKKNNWIILQSNNFNLLYFPLYIRKQLLDVLHKNALSGDEYSVASAILLGYNQLMESDIKQSYAAAGVVHVLCVSGLHVGIIFLIFNLMLSFLKKTKKQRFFKATILIIVIWFYAMLTGMSPSVSRASVMITLFIIGDNLQRDNDHYNTLAASAFILLAINPMLLFNVGFQLSYAAVLGILLFYKPIYAILYFKSKLLDVLWSVVALSFAAQSGAFPIAAHYFHTFPTYFILTNLAVFTLVYLIVISGILFFIFSQVSPIALVLGKVLSGIVYIMNLVVKFVASLPHAQISELYFPWMKVIFIYGIILGFLFWILKKENRYLLLLLGSMILFVGFQTVLKMQRNSQSQIIIYDVKKGIAIDLVNKNKHLLLADSEAVKNIDFVAGNFWIHQGLKKNTFLLSKHYYHNQNFIYDNGFIGLNEKTGYIADDSVKFFPKLKHRIKLDFIMLPVSKPPVLQEMSKSFTFNNIIIPAALSSYWRKRIKKEAEKMQIKYYDIKKNGALLLTTVAGKKSK